MKIPIENDVLFIADRLKEIDPALRVYLDTQEGCYEVWGLDKSLAPYSLASFHRLDGRVIEAVGKGYWMFGNYSRPYKKFLRDQEIDNDIAHERWRKKVNDIGYGMQDDLRFAGKVVGKGCNFQH